MPGTDRGNNRNYEMQNVTQAFDLIDVLLAVREGLTLTHLAQRIGMGKSKMFRLLSTLEQRGLVEKNQQGHYRLGLTAFGTARRILDSESMLDYARPIMNELVEAFDEAVYLAVSSKEKAMLLDMSDCRQQVKAASFVGRYFLFPTTAAGVTVDTGGLDTEITTVAAPFSDNGGARAGALVVLAPRFRMPPERIAHEIAPLLAEAAQQLSLQLGAVNERNPPAHLQPQLPGKTSMLPAFITMQPQNYPHNSRHCQQ